MLLSFIAFPFVWSFCNSPFILVWIRPTIHRLMLCWPREKWNESGFRPPLCTYRLNWARRTSWGWWDDWDDTVLQTQDSKFEPWRSEAEHATSRSRRLPTILTFTRGWGRNIFVSLKPPRPGTEPRTLAWKAAVLTTTLGPPPRETEVNIADTRKHQAWQCWLLNYCFGEQNVCFHSEKQPHPSSEHPYDDPVLVQCRATFAPTRWPIVGSATLGQHWTNTGSTSPVLTFNNPGNTRHWTYGRLTLSSLTLHCHLHPLQAANCCRNSRLVVD